MKKCPKCGNVTDSAFCGNCGTDLRDETEYLEVDQVLVDEITVPDDKVSVIEDNLPMEEAVQPAKKKNKKALILVLIAVVTVAGFYLISQGLAKEDYKSSLYDLMYEMGNTAAEAESACNLIGVVWSDAIFETTDNEETKKYVSGAKDFDEALANLFSDEEFLEKIKTIQEGEASVDNIMAGLKNPPSEYEDLYNDVIDAYADFSEFVSLATSPSGSYNSYTERFRELDSSLAKALNRISAKLP